MLPGAVVGSLLLAPIKLADRPFNAILFRQQRRLPVEWEQPIWLLAGCDGFKLSGDLLPSVFEFVSSVHGLPSCCVRMYKSGDQGATVKSSDLTYEQLRRLEKSLKPKLGYVRKLKARMMQREFPDRDRMYRDVQMAERGLHDLLMEIETLMSYKKPRTGHAR
jgi:hypothetical protein